MTPCCDRMKEELEWTCAHGHSPSECPDVLIAYVAKFDEFGIRVHDGGSSIVRIAFCPWCGTRLPESKRDRWFDELERRGIDPYEHEVPPEFRRDAWYAQTQPES